MHNVIVGITSTGKNGGFVLSSPLLLSKSNTEAAAILFQQGVTHCLGKGIQVVSAVGCGEAKKWQIWGSFHSGSPTATPFLLPSTNITLLMYFLSAKASRNGLAHLFTLLQTWFI